MPLIGAENPPLARTPQHDLLPEILLLRIFCCRFLFSAAASCRSFSRLVLITLTIAKTWDLRSFLLKHALPLCLNFGIYCSFKSYKLGRISSSNSSPFARISILSQYETSQIFSSFIFCVPSSDSLSMPLWDYRKLLGTTKYPRDYWRDWGRVRITAIACHSSIAQLRLPVF